MTADMIPQLLGYFVGGAAVYAAIRADLVAAKMRAEQAVQDASKAHERIDAHINDHVRGM